MPPAKRKRDSELLQEITASHATSDNASASDDEDHSQESDGHQAHTTSVRRRNSQARQHSSDDHETPAPGAVNGAGKPLDDANGGENGEAGSMRMEAPPKGGIVHPEGGYRTNDPPTGRKVRVYADGVFDLFHLGHMRQLEQAKKAFPDIYLLVGVTGDKETHKRKGLTVMSAKERSETVRHCKWVDEVIEDCPWVLTVDFLEKHDIDYVAHDDLPYGASEGDDIYKPIKERGMFLVTQRTEGVSTTGIITRIVRDYESYISRQLKRGTSRQELNISWFKKNELDIKRQVSEIRKSIRENWTTTGQELGKDFRQFWQAQASGQTSPAPGGAAHSTRAGRPVDMPEAALESPTGLGRTARSPGAWSRLSVNSQHDGPMRDKDFAAGYAMGLIGGVRSWMQRTRRNLADGSRAPSPTSDEMEDERDSHRSRTKTSSSDEDDEEHDDNNDKEDEDESAEDSGRARKRGRLSRESEQEIEHHQTVRV